MWSADFPYRLPFYIYLAWNCVQPQVWMSMRCCFMFSYEHFSSSLNSLRHVCGGWERKSKRGMACKGPTSNAFTFQSHILLSRFLFYPILSYNMRHLSQCLLKYLKNELHHALCPVIRSAASVLSYRCYNRILFVTKDKDLDATVRTRLIHTHRNLYLYMLMVGFRHIVVEQFAQACGEENISVWTKWLPAFKKKKKEWTRKH